MQSDALLTSNGCRHLQSRFYCNLHAMYLQTLAEMMWFQTCLLKVMVELSSRNPKPSEAPLNLKQECSVSKVKLHEGHLFLHQAILSHVGQCRTLLKKCPHTHTPFGMHYLLLNSIDGEVLSLSHSLCQVELSKALRMH